MPEQDPSIAKDQKQTYRHIANSLTYMAGVVGAIYVSARHESQIGHFDTDAAVGYLVGGLCMVGAGVNLKERRKLRGIVSRKTQDPTNKLDE